MLNFVTGDLLQANVEAIVNPVNCVGVMGKGLALQFKNDYPGNFVDYATACKRGIVKPGVMHIHRVQSSGLDFGGPDWIINFPTKRHWRDASRIEDIQAGLVTLAWDVERLKIQSIALPQLGCGLGGLDWNDVRPLIEEAFSATTDVEVIVFGPR